MAVDNVSLAERYHMDIFQKGSLEAADELVSKDFLAHSPGLPPEWSRGPAGVKQWAKAIRTGLPDANLTHHEVVAQGDTVVIRWSATGTHDGEMMGVPPTGKFVEITGFDLFHVKGGKLVEMWQNWDQLGFLQQVGAVPTPG